MIKIDQGLHGVQWSNIPVWSNQYTHLVTLYLTDAVKLTDLIALFHIPTKDITHHKRYHPLQKISPTTKDITHYRRYHPLQKISPTTKDITHYKRYHPLQKISPTTKDITHYKRYHPPQKISPTTKDITHHHTVTSRLCTGEDLSHNNNAFPYHSLMVTSAIPSPISERLKGTTFPKRAAVNRKPLMVSMCSPPSPP